mgnify:CR=1 FL=1
MGKDESEEKDYASAFAALSDEEDVGVMVGDSAAQSVHLLLKTAAEDASAARRERIAVIGGSEETVAQMVNRAKAVNSERVVLVGPDIASDDGGTMSAVFAAAAVAAVIAGNTDPSVPINGAELTLFGAAGKRLSDNEIDQLVRGGVTPIETVGGVSSPVRGITTKTSSGGAAEPPAGRGCAVSGGGRLRPPAGGRGRRRPGRWAGGLARSTRSCPGRSFRPAPAAGPLRRQRLHRLRAGA